MTNAYKKVFRLFSKDLLKMEENKEKKAAQGIGTLIIFIAMILVAAVAAGVLIQTAASLQSKSLDVGRQSQEKISTDLEVTQVFVVDTSDGQINGGSDNLSIDVRLGSGSMPIKLSDLLIKVDSSGAKATMNYVVGTNMSETTYLATYLINGSQHLDGYIAPGDVVEFNMIIKSGINISEGDRLIVRMIPKNGVVKPVDMTIPSAIIESVTYLYP